MNSRSTVIVSGALAGGLIAIAFLALFAGRFSMGSLWLTSGGDADLSVTSGALYLAAVVAALRGGVAVAVIAYGVSSDDDESVNRFGLAHILP